MAFTLVTELSLQKECTADNPSRMPSLFIILVHTEENESSGASAAKKKKKRVYFGCPLSPEFFDQQLPPSTPLQKGGTPARPSTPGVILKLKSALRTPQRKESCTPQAQADLGHVFDGSPVLAMSYNHRMLHMAEDGVEKFEKVCSLYFIYFI